MTEKNTDFTFEWQNRLGDIGELEDKLRGEADTRLRKLAKGNTDLIGASIVLEHEDEGRTTHSSYRARVVVYTRPQYINATEVADTIQASLKGALTAVERQVREKREKLRESWKQS